jgi:hypothetical protein
MKITELLGAAAIVRGGARASQTLSQSLVAGLNGYAADRVRSDVGEGSTALEHQYYGAAVTPLSIRQVMDRFVAFAEDEMAEWRKLAAHTTADGVAVAVYTRRISPRLALQARSYWGRIVQNEHRQHGRGGSRLQSSVAYRYRTEFELRAQGPHRTHVSFRTTETIDPEFASGYDLRQHFEVPRMPGGVGRAGERFLASLPR